MASERAPGEHGWRPVRALHALNAPDTACRECDGQLRFVGGLKRRGAWPGLDRYQCDGCGLGALHRTRGRDREEACGLAPIGRSVDWVRCQNATPTVRRPRTRGASQTEPGRARSGDR